LFTNGWEENVMLRLLKGLCGVVLAGLASIAVAEGGRYQAVVIPEAGRSAGTGSLTTRVFILDTVDGHLWIWGEREAIYDQAGKPRFGTSLIYQGRVRPGQKMGEVIERTVE
jgi:hypothetical protein